MEELLISIVQDEIVHKLKLSNTLLIIASTGSGKSTLLPGILVSNGYTDNGIVGISQPRRVAAISLAKRVSSLLNCKIGGFVGVSVRFHNNTTAQTRVLFATDGILVREALIDPIFSRFSVIIVDEAHERSLRSDVLFGLLVIAQRRRPELKVVIMSATLEYENFVKFFKDVQLVKVEGRQHPIEIHHIRSECEDYLEAAVFATLMINSRSEPGDILVFLPGQEEIESFCGILNSKLKKIEQEAKGKTPKSVLLRIGKRTCNYSQWMQMVILPLYAALPLAQQELVFVKAHNMRKVCVSPKIHDTILYFST